MTWAMLTSLRWQLLQVMAFEVMLLKKLLFESSLWPNDVDDDAQLSFPIAASSLCSYAAYYVGAPLR